MRRASWMRGVMPVVVKIIFWHDLGSGGQMRCYGGDIGLCGLVLKWVLFCGFCFVWNGDLMTVFGFCFIALRCLSSWWRWLWWLASFAMVGGGWRWLAYVCIFKYLGHIKHLQNTWKWKYFTLKQTVRLKSKFSLKGLFCVNKSSKWKVHNEAMKKDAMGL